jgi:hypothetical protein
VYCRENLSSRHLVVVVVVVVVVAAAVVIDVVDVV